MHGPISSNLDFGVDYEQELPKITTSNTPISLSTTSVSKDSNPQHPPTEPNRMVPNYTPSGRTSKVSKNLDFETNYIDQTTAMSVTGSNELSQAEKTHSVPPGEVHRDKESSDSVPLHETHQTNETLINGYDLDKSDSKPPQSNVNEKNIPHATAQSETVESELAPETVEESKLNLTPTSEPNKGSNSELMPTAIEENTLETTPKSKSDEILKEKDKSDGDLISSTQDNLSICDEVDKSCNKSAEILPTTQENLNDMKSQPETNQEGISFSTAANLGTANSESTEKSSVSTQSSLNIADQTENSSKTTVENSQSSSSDQSKSDADENNKPIEESKPDVMPESKIETIPEEIKDKIDENPITTDSISSISDTIVIEKSTSPDQSMSPKHEIEDSTVITTAAPKNEIVSTITITTPIVTPIPSTINDNEHIQETSPPKVEHMDAVTSMANPAENEINKSVTTSLPPPTSPPRSPQPSMRPNTNDEKNESTNDKIIEETENASTVMDVSIKLMLPLVCLILVPHNNIWE